MKNYLLLIVSLFLIPALKAQTTADLEAQGIEIGKQPVKTAGTAFKMLDEIPAGGLLLIPESGQDRVVAFDPQTGDLMDEYYILDDDVTDFFSTPIQVIQNPEKTRLYVSDQLKDYVVEFDNDGNYLGIFAPAGGANPDILDNVRGIDIKSGTSSILISDGNHDAVIEFDGGGNLVGNFTAAGLVDPFDVLYWEAYDQYLVCDISGGDDADAVKVFDNAGNYLSDLISNIDFPEQVSLTPSGNILVATFTTPSGVYEYAPDGTFIGYYNVVSSCRGVYELPNGNMLVTSGDAVYEVSKNNTIVSVKYQVSNASFRFISLVTPPGDGNYVTFKVDMSQQTVAPEGVHIAGSFQGWDPGATPMTDMGNGLYTYTAMFEEAEEIEYKFVNGDEWGEDETVPAECAQNGNRYLTIPAQDTILTAVCFGSCDPCGPQAMITFQVDMSEQTVSGDGVHLAGDFQGWDPAADEMTLLGDNIYEISFNLPVGSHQQFKFINGMTWDGEETVPEECGEDNGVGGFNRFIDVPVNDTVLTAYCFSSCDSCDLTPDEYIVTFMVDMTEENVSLNGVHLAGDFQGWDPAATPMEIYVLGENIYTVDVTLYEGMMYEYKFINGNDWDGSETVPEACGVDDGQGGFNRYVTVPASDTTMTALCFSSCDTCTPVGIESQLFKFSDQLSVYPNPFEHDIVLQYSGNKQADLNLELYNAMGQMILSIKKQEVQSGADLHIPFKEELPTGVYYMRATIIAIDQQTEPIMIKIIKR